MWILILVTWSNGTYQDLQTFGDFDSKSGCEAALMLKGAELDIPTLAYTPNWYIAPQYDGSISIKSSIDASAHLQKDDGIKLDLECITSRPDE